MGLSVAIFTRLLGWTVEELEVFLVDVRREMRDTSIHAYWSMLVLSFPFTPPKAFCDILIFEIDMWSTLKNLLMLDKVRNLRGVMKVKW